MKINKLLIGLLIFVFLYLTFGIFIQTPGNTNMFGDQATHYMQSMSVAFDHDLKYTNEDLERYYKYPISNDGPKGLFIKKGIDNNWFFAKPLILSVVSSPVVLIFKELGFPIFNLILTIVMFILSYLWLRKTNDKNKSIIIVLAFFLFSNFTSYIYPAYADIFYGFLIFTTFFGLLYPTQLNNKIIIFSAVLYGLSIYEKLPFILFLPIILWIIYKKYSKKSILLFISVFLAIFLIPTGINYQQDNNFNSYSGERYYIRNISETNDINNTEKKLLNTGISLYGNFFESVSTKLFDTLNISLVNNSLYFFGGKQTGIIYYNFMGLLILMLTVINSKNHKDKIPLSLLAGILLYIEFYFILLPNNYFGGSQSFGNRYFLQIYPLFIYLINYRIDFKKIPKILYLSIIILIILFYKIWTTPFNGNLDNYKAIISSFPFSALPIEKTQIDTILEGDSVEIDKDTYLYPINQNFYKDQNGKLWGKANSTLEFIIKSNADLSTKKLYIYSPTGDNILINEEKLEMKKKEVTELALSNYLNNISTIDKDYFLTMKIETGNGVAINEQNMGLLIGVPNDATIQANFQDFYLKKIYGFKRSTDTDMEKIFKKNPIVKIFIKNIYNFGEIIDFSKNGNSALFTMSGWNNPEETHTWTNGKNVELKISLQRKPNLDLTLSIKASPLIIPGKFDGQLVDVYIKNTKIGQWNIKNTGEYKMLIQKKYIDSSVLDIKFYIPNASAQPQSTIDNRILGIAINHAFITETETYNLGEEIKFTKNNKSNQSLITGSIPEEAHTWTNGEKSNISIPLSFTEIESDLTMSLTAFPFIVPGIIKSQNVNIYIGGDKIGQWHIEKYGEYKIIIPKKYINSPLLEITLLLPDAKSPSELGINKDDRILAIAIQKIVLIDQKKI